MPRWDKQNHQKAVQVIEHSYSEAAEGVPFCRFANMLGRPGKGLCPCNTGRAGTSKGGIVCAMALR